MCFNCFTVEDFFECHFNIHKADRAARCAFGHGLFWYSKGDNLHFGAYDFKECPELAKAVARAREKYCQAHFMLGQVRVLIRKLEAGIDLIEEAIEEEKKKKAKKKFVALKYRMRSATQYYYNYERKQLFLPLRSRESKKIKDHFLVKLKQITKPFLTQPEVLNLFGLSTQRWRRFFFCKYPPPYCRFNQTGHYKFNTSELQEWINKHKVDFYDLFHTPVWDGRFSCQMTGVKIWPEKENIKDCLQSLARKGV